MCAIEHTLRFDNPREAQDIIGSRFSLITRVEQLFSIEIHQRDLWLRWLVMRAMF